MDLNVNKPFLLPENRVWRIYRGGKLIDIFRNNPAGEDDFFPEDWIGSTTKATNSGREHFINEGVSKVNINNNGQEILLTDLLKDKNNCLQMFGEKHYKAFGNSSEILVKLLDSLIRLPVQSHPDRKFSMKHFNVNHGKAESWIILGGREINGEPPHVYFGFRENVSKESFDKNYYAQNVSGLVNSLNKVYVKPGDIFVIPGNTIHAIGSGVFLMEIQEPSDFVFQFDRKGECWDLNDFQIHMNLGDKIMLDSLDYSSTGEQTLDKYYSHFPIENNTEGIKSILPDYISNYFRCIFITSLNTKKPVDTFSIGIVIDGEGVLTCKHGSTSIKKGDTYLIPYSTGEINYISQNRNKPLKIMEALPPVI